MSTFELRKKFLAIARTNVGKLETSRNQGSWIKPLWTATDYPGGYEERQPYCAASVAWVLREWLKDPEVLKALNLTAAQAEKWRCKSASCFRADNSWESWARQNSLLLPKTTAVLHAGDLIIYSFSHIEMYVDDLPDGKFIAIGYNTGGGPVSPDGTVSRDGDGCFEKPRSRAKIRSIIRMLP